MQKKILFEKINTQRSRLIEKLSSIDAIENIDPIEIKSLIAELETLTKDLAVAGFIKDNHEKHNELNVHLKIMENISKQEEAKVITSTPENETPKTEPEIKQETVIPVVEKEAKHEPENINQIITKKKIEFGLNDKYRIINELFHQSQAEFSAALDQLNLTDSWEDAESYLNNLKSIYSWKAEHPMVKLLYSFTQKRFQ